MDSIELYTEEIDDLEEAVEELFSQFEGFKLKKNTLAILHTEEDTDYPELYRLLSKKFDFPIIGCTTLAMLLGKEGYCGMGTGIVVMTADDVEFSVGITPELTRENYRDEITKKYNELLENLNDPPKLVITYGGMALSEDNVAGDDVMEVIDEIGNKIPIFGGLASDGFTFSGFRVFYNGESSKNGQVITLVSGNIAPKFITNNSIENRANFSYKVTKSESNRVMRLGNGTFVETLKRENMAIDKTEVLGDYILSPFVLTLNRENGDSIEVARNLSLLNQETGSGTFLGSVPEGAILSIGLINRSDVQKSVDQTFEKVFKELGNSENEYHTLLCTSCAARFLALASNTSAEADAYKGKLPADVSLLGIYGFGEYCPVKGNKTGIDYNFFHNFTFTMMAI